MKKKMIAFVIVVAALVLPAATCATDPADSHATPAWEVAGYTVQAGDAMDLACAPNPTDPNCDAFSK